jgi:hypothetical protein
MQLPTTLFMNYVHNPTHRSLAELKQDRKLKTLMENEKTKQALESYFRDETERIKEKEELRTQALNEKYRPEEKEHLTLSLL